MRSGHYSKWVAIAVLCMGTTAAQAATIWDEAVNGDLSNDGEATTPVVMTVGPNRVIGATGNSGQGVDADHFRFTVPPGTRLTSITLLDNTTVSGGSSFFGIAVGPSISATNLLTFLHYSADQIGSNLMPMLGTGPLASGTYSVWVQETGGPVKYGFEFVTTPVAINATVPTLPEWGLLLLGALLALIAWRKSQREAPRTPA